MKTEDLLYSAGETIEYAKIYAEQQMSLIKLETAKRAAVTTASLSTISIIAFLLFMAVIFLSIALGFYLGGLFGSYTLAFVTVAGVYILATVIIFFFKHSILTVPIRNIIIKNMLD